MKKWIRLKLLKSIFLQEIKLHPPLLEQQSDGLNGPQTLVMEILERTKKKKNEFGSRQAEQKLVMKEEMTKLKEVQKTTLNNMQDNSRRSIPDSPQEWIEECKWHG